MQQRVKAYPEMMVRRRSIVENPFGSFKQWLFGNGRFLLCQLNGALEGIYHYLRGKVVILYAQHRLVPFQGRGQPGGGVRLVRVHLA